MSSGWEGACREVGCAGWFGGIERDCIILHGLGVVLRSVLYFGPLNPKTSSSAMLPE